MTTTRLLVATALLAVTCTAAADEAAVRRMVQDQMRRGATIESVQKTPWGDVYEVVMRGALPLDEVRRLLDAASPGKR